jgi:hypothetical protein
LDAHDLDVVVGPVAELVPEGRKRGAARRAAGVIEDRQDAIALSFVEDTGVNLHHEIAVLHTRHLALYLLAIHAILWEAARRGGDGHCRHEAALVHGGRVGKRNSSHPVAGLIRSHELVHLDIYPHRIKAGKEGCCLLDGALLVFAQRAKGYVVDDGINHDGEPRALVRVAGLRAVGAEHH